MTCSFFRRGKQDVVSPELSKMNDRLSFSKNRSPILCSSLDSNGEDCWTFCPSCPRFFRREAKQKMVEVLLLGKAEFVHGWICVVKNSAE